VTRVLVLTPVLGRPERAAPVAASIRASDDRAEPLFLCSPGDDDEIAACRDSGWTIVVPWECGPADYGRKMNRGVELARSYGFDWAFLGADDLVFHPGWLDQCLRVWERTGACVVGTNDMGNQRVISGRHSTHTLVHVDYLDCGTIDEAGKILHEGYGHSFCDDEFVQTAQMRGTYVHAGEAFVEHQHPNWGKGEDDATYRKGMSSFDADRRLYERRKQMFARRMSAGERRRG
jgi:hypothetical protein